MKNAAPRVNRVLKPGKYEKGDIETLRRPRPLYLTKLECEFCGRTFMTKDALTRHIENKHPEVA